MISYQFALYLGKEKEGVVFSYLIKENFIGILKIEGKFEKEEGKKFLDYVYSQLDKKSNSFLDTLDEAVSKAIIEINIPANFSSVIGFITDQILYVKTVNTGAVYIKRDNKIGEIISDDNQASGYIKKEDYFIFSFKNFFQKTDENNLLRIIGKKPPYEIVEELNSFLKNNNDEGLAGLIIRFFEKDDETKKMVPPPIFENIFRLKRYFNNFHSKKKIGIFLALLITIFLLINISRGLFDSLSNNQLKKIEKTRQLVINKLNEAEDTAFFNIKQSQQLINEAKNELNNLKKELASKHPQKIREIEKIIDEKERIVFKKEEKQPEEFYDLTIEAKNVQGDHLYLDKENLVILDKKNGKIFNLNLTKKSLNSFTNLKIKSSDFAVSYNNNIFFFVPNEGVYQVEEEKIKRVIESDKDWGKIVDFWIYNGNIYLLDKEKDEVYKYLVVDNGYSSKKSYFQPGEAIDLADVNSTAIDGAVYLGFSDYILKYLSGIRENFKVSFPEESINITKIFTNKDLEKVFAWGRKKSVVYVFSKKGGYERVVKSGILSKTQDFVVFDQKIYLLLGNKIYTINL